MKNFSLIFLFFIIFFFLLSLPSYSQVCQYTCKECFGSQYFQCTKCHINRGSKDTWLPIAGMCYCTGDKDEDNNGACMTTMEYNKNNKAIIATFIGLALLFTVAGSLTTGFRHFLIKTIEDIQQISIIVFINLYFPQQFDIFLTYLYRFNISSYTFQSIAQGSLFTLGTENLIESRDGQNIYGKYKLLYKTVNFFSNQFTWLIVFICVVAVAIILRFIRNRMKAHRESQGQGSSRNKNQMEASMQNINQNSNNFETKITSEGSQIKNSSKVDDQKNTSFVYRWVNKIYNFTWLNFFIIFFYLSLIEININIFTQISNLTFSSPFAAVGAFFSALFLAVQLVVIALLVLKIRQQTIKPQWMRDYGYTAPIYMIRTNYKTVTKYFWTFCCIKKILLGLMITVMYHDPNSAILGISSVQIAFLCFTVYCEPHERRYIRIHYYSTEGMKLFLYVCLINFTEQYVEYARMIELTKILYFMLAIFFGFNFFYILLNLFAERHIYIRAWIKRLYPESESQYVKGKLVYHSQGKLFVYERQ